MTRKILTAVGFIAALATTLLVAELWVRSRYSEVPSAARANELRLPGDLVQTDPVLGHHFRPNSTKFFTSPYGEFKVNYQINEIGLRESGMISAVGQPPLVIVLGDSFVEGWGVMPEATFVLETQRQLRQLDGINQFTRILNGGMTNFGAAQSYLLGRRLVEDLDPDIVVLVYNSLMPVLDHRFLAQAEVDENGIAVRATQTELADQNTSGEHSSPLYESALYKLTRNYIDLKNDRETHTPGDPDSDLFAAARGSGERVVDLHRRSLAHVAALAEFAKGRGKKFMLLHVPLPHQVAADEWTEGRNGHGFEARIYGAPEIEIIEAFCNAQKIRCLMSASMFKALAEQRSSRVYFRHDYALTEVGHRALVNFLLEPMRLALGGRPIDVSF